MAKSYRTFHGPPAWEAPEPDSDEKREANRARVAGGKTKKSAPVSTDPRIADSKRSRRRSRERAMKAASENREAKRYE